MDLTQEINELERAKDILKEEPTDRRNDIMKVINPLHVISRVNQSQMKIGNGIARISQGPIHDNYSRVEIGDVAHSQFSIPPLKVVPTEEKIAHLMVNNT